MQFLEINATGTYQVKVGPGYLQGIVVNVPGSATIQISDTAATSVAAPYIAGGTAVALPAAGSALRYDCHFSNGLLIKIASMSSGSITVSYN